MSSSSRCPDEDLPCDFLAFFERGVALESGPALARLGEELASYQPGPVARSMAISMGRYRDAKLGKTTFDPLGRTAAA